MSQYIQLPFKAGIDEGTDPKQLPAGTLKVGQNVRQDKPLALVGPRSASVHVLDRAELARDEKLPPRYAFIREVGAGPWALVVRESDEATIRFRVRSVALSPGGTA